VGTVRHRRAEQGRSQRPGKVESINGATGVSDGKVQGTFPVGDFPSGIAFDGASIWVTSVHDNAVTRLRAKNGAYTKTLTVENYPIGVLFDNTSIWVANYFSNTVSKISRSAQ